MGPGGAGWRLARRQPAVGESIAFTAFALCLVVAALECRSEIDTIVMTATFGSRQRNRALIAELVLAVLTTQMDGLRRVLGTVELTFPQFAWDLIPPLALLILWEIGKLVARRRGGAAVSTSCAESLPLLSGHRANHPASAGGFLCARAVR